MLHVVYRSYGGENAKGRPPFYSKLLALPLQRRWPDADLVLFADARTYDVFGAIDGSRRIGVLGPGAAGIVERLWRHDLVVVDTTGDASARRGG